MTAQPVDDLVAAMVNRFLAWKLPADFLPDCGISFKPEYNQHTPWPAKHEPVGTNLFTADQARAMFEHCLPEQLRAAQPVDDLVERLRALAAFQHDDLSIGEEAAARIVADAKRLEIWSRAIDERDAHNRKLIAALAAAQVDAERYRWLRSAAKDKNGNRVAIHWNIGHDWIEDYQLDAAIDAARSAKP